MSDRTRTFIIGVVTAVWALNFVAGLVVPTYNTSESINAIFMAIVGGLFALGTRAHDSSDDRSDSSDGRHKRDE